MKRTDRDKKVKQYLDEVYEKSENIFGKPVKFFFMNDLLQGTKFPPGFILPQYFYMAREENAAIRKKYTKGMHGFWRFFGKVGMTQLTMHEFFDYIDSMTPSISEAERDFIYEAVKNAVEKKNPIEESKQKVLSSRKWDDKDVERIETLFRYIDTDIKFHDYIDKSNAIDDNKDITAAEKRKLKKSLAKEYDCRWHIPDAESFIWADFEYGPTSSREMFEKNRDEFQKFLSDPDTYDGEDKVHFVILKKIYDAIK